MSRALARQSKEKNTNKNRPQKNTLKLNQTKTTILSKNHSEENLQKGI